MAPSTSRFNLNPPFEDVPRLTRRTLLLLTDVWIHEMSEFSQFRKYVILCKSCPCLLSCKTQWADEVGVELIDVIV